MHAFVEGDCSVAFFLVQIVPYKVDGKQWKYDNEKNCDYNNFYISNYLFLFLNDFHEQFNQMVWVHKVFWDLYIYCK